MKEQNIPLALVPGSNLRLRLPAAQFIIAPIKSGETPRLETKMPEVWSQKKDGNDFSLSIDLPPWKAGDQRARIFLPDDVSLSIQMGAGHIRGEHLRLRALELDTEAGQIDIYDVHARMRLRSGAGAINAREVAGAIDAETNMGAIRIGLNDLDPGNHSIRASIGAIRVWLAANINVRIETEAPMGSVRSRFASKPDAAAVLHLHAGVGAIRVQETEPTPSAPHDWLDAEAWMEWAAQRFAPQPRRRDARPFTCGPFGEGFSGAAHPGASANNQRQSASPIDEGALRKILDLVREKKISIEDAEQLISAL